MDSLPSVISEVDMTHPVPLVVLISGSGSNLQAIMDTVARGGVNAEIRAVISNRAQAYGLERARSAGIHTEVLDHRTHEGRTDFDRELRRRIEAFEPGLVVLAGFMRILTEEMTTPFEGRILNIHPSLLPRYRGLHTHERVLKAQESRHGCSVHFVTNELDGGPVIIQATVPVLPKDTSERLAARVLEKEHIIYPLAVRWYCTGRLRLHGHRVNLDGRPLEAPIQLGDVPAAELRFLGA